MQIQQIIIVLTVLFIRTIAAAPADLASPESRLMGQQACVASPDWVVSSHIQPADCAEALDIFRRAEFPKGGSQPLEFIARGAHPATHLTTITTPRKYRFRTCTVAVAMFASIPPWLMPPTMERRRFALNDVASFDGLRQAAKQIITDCVQFRGRRPLVGWQEMGRLSKAIGVFVWETGSPVDRALRPWNDLLMPGANNESAPIGEPSYEA
ncbi:MAG: hypothetical protein Q9205_002058 [Flavoplaca limonia]